MSYFGWHFWLVGVFRCSPSHKITLKKLTSKREINFSKTSENC